MELRASFGDVRGLVQGFAGPDTYALFKESFVIADGKASAKLSFASLDFTIEAVDGSLAVDLDNVRLKFIGGAFGAVRKIAGDRLIKTINQTSLPAKATKKGGNVHIEVDGVRFITAGFVSDQLFIRAELL